MGVVETIVGVAAGLAVAVGLVYAAVKKFSPRS
jgi:hypothetical protein